MKVIIAGGGTGGHLYPGIAIARELLQGARQRGPVRRHGAGHRGQGAPEEGLPVRFITVGKLKGMKLCLDPEDDGHAAAEPAPVAAPAARSQAGRGDRRRRLFLGPGGACGVGLRIPLFIVEPNSYAGLANRMLGRLAEQGGPLFSRDRTRRSSSPEQRQCMLGPLVRKGIEQGDRDKALAGFRA